MVTTYKTKRGAISGIESGNCLSVNQLSPELMGNKEVILKLLNHVGIYAYCIRSNIHVEAIAPSLLGDKDVALAAVAINGYNLKHLSPEMQADADVVNTALSQTSYCVEYISPKLMSDRSFVENLISKSELAMQYASPELKDDRDLALLALQCTHVAYKDLSPRLQHDKEIAIAALNSGCYFSGGFSSPGGWIPAELMADRDVAVAALRCDSFNYRYLPEQMQRELDPYLAVEGFALPSFGTYTAKPEKENSDASLANSDKIAFRAGYHEWNVFVGDECIYSVDKDIVDDVCEVDAQGLEYLVEDIISLMQDELANEEKMVLAENEVECLKSKMISAWQEYTKEPNGRTSNSLDTLIAEAEKDGSPTPPVQNERSEKSVDAR